MGEQQRGVRIDTTTQVSLFCGLAEHHRPAEERTAVAGFRESDPGKIFLGSVRLDRYLEQAGLRTPIIVRTILEEQNWTSFEATYKSGGRPAYAPMSMVGLILYGNMHGVDSLRELESLARKDLGCMWVSGGITPDHSVIGRFIVDHGELLEKDFFVQLTRTVLSKTNSHGRELAGDGTVLQAAAARYGALKADALADFAVKARACAAENAQDARLQQQAERAEKALELLAKRSQARSNKGRDPAICSISAIEPDAVIQPLKDKSVAPSYKPSVLANDKRVIVAQTVDGSSETKVLQAMLDQAEQASGEQTETLLLDAGYHSDQVIAQSISRDINLLCPTGTPDKDGEFERKANGVFLKRAFVYNESTDTYRCPAGEALVRISGPAAVTNIDYGTPKCSHCPLRSRCTTKSVGGRIVTRNSGDAAKEALAEVMRHPGAQLAYCQRKAMVEPVFADIKERQRFRRFRRRGLALVRVEFALHAMAHNLRRLVAAVWAVLLRLIVMLLTHASVRAPHPA